MEIPVDILLRLRLILSAILTATALGNWPQAAGPNGTWIVPDAKPPVSWSVARNENILLRAPLPNGGQSGIAVWGNRLFLTTFEPYRQGAPKTSATILGHAMYYSNFVTNSAPWGGLLQLANPVGGSLPGVAQGSEAGGGFHREPPGVVDV